MRSLLAALTLFAATLVPHAVADEPKLIELEVGETKPLAGFRPLCDDPFVVSLLGGSITALKAGQTVCSLSSGSPVGPRQVYRVVVRPPPPPDPKGAGKSKGG